MDCVTASIIVPIASLRNVAPLRFRAIVVYACKSATTTERIIAYRRNATTDCHACQAAATTKRRIAYRRDTVGNGYTCQAATTTERKITYRRDAAVSRYHTVFATQNQCFACGFNNTIPLAVVFSITYSNFDVCQIVATSERIITYRRDTVGNCYTCQAAATNERTRAYRRDATTDCYACQAATIVERIVRDFFYVIAEC